MFKKLVFLVIIGLCKADDFFSEEQHGKGWKKCPDAKPTIEIPPDFYLKTVGDIYFVMGNKWFVISLTRHLTGKPPTSRDSVKDACFKELRAGKDLKTRITGYGGKMAEYSCKGNPGEQQAVVKQNCSITTGLTTQQWTSYGGSKDDTIVWTFNKLYGGNDKTDMYAADDDTLSDYVMGVSCIGGKATWSVRSQNNTSMPQNIQKLVLEQAVKLGFAPEDAVDIPRESCKDK